MKKLFVALACVLMFSGCYYRDPYYSTYPTYPTYPSPAENGDLYNFDNDGDGRVEPIHVNGYHRTDGTYVRGHYRAKPSTPTYVNGYFRSNGTYVNGYWRK